MSIGDLIVIAKINNFQFLRKCKNRADCPTYYRNVLAYACGVPSILGILTLFTLICVKAERLERNERRRID